MKQIIASNPAYVIAILLYLFCANVNAQDSTRRNRNLIFNTKVYNMNGELLTDGYLVQVNDTSVIVSFIPVPYTVSRVNGRHLSHIRYDDINYLKYKRKGSVGRGILIGTITGLITGAIIGLAQGDEEVVDRRWGWGWGPSTVNVRSAGQNAVVYGLGMGVVGAITGAIIGAISNMAKKTITINGSPSALKELNYTLLERVYSTK